MRCARSLLFLLHLLSYRAPAATSWMAGVYPPIFSSAESRGRWSPSYLVRCILRSFSRPLFSPQLQMIGSAQYLVSVLCLYFGRASDLIGSCSCLVVGLVAKGLRPMTSRLSQTEQFFGSIASPATSSLLHQHYPFVLAAFVASHIPAHRSPSPGRAYSSFLLSISRTFRPR